MRFQLTESNRQGLSGASVLLGLIVVGSAVAFGCSGGDRDVAVRATESTPVRPASTVSQPTVTEPVSDAPSGVVPVVSESAAPKTVVPDNVTFADGEAAYAAGDYQRALVLFEAFVERRPHHAWGHFMLGLAARKAGEPEFAVAAFEEALSLDPGHVKSHFNQGRTLLDLDRPEDALAAFETGVELDPGNGEGYRLLGRAYHRLGDTESALASYREALMLDTGDAWSLNNYGLILIEDGRGDEAVGPLARAVEVRGDVVFMHNNLGMALELAGRPDQAGTAYRDALALEPGHGKAESNLARVERAGTPPGDPIDLRQAAEAFAATIDTWRAPSPEPEAFVPEIVDSVLLVRDTIDEIEPIDVTWQ